MYGRVSSSLAVHMGFNRVAYAQARLLGQAAVSLQLLVELPAITLRQAANKIQLLAHLLGGFSQIIVLV